MEVVLVPLAAHVMPGQLPLGLSFLLRSKKTCMPEIAGSLNAFSSSLGGSSTLFIQTTGTYTGALSLQATADGTNWVTVGGVPLINLNTGGYLGTITSALASVFVTTNPVFGVDQQVAESSAQDITRCQNVLSQFFTQIGTPDVE